MRKSPCPCLQSERRWASRLFDFHSTSKTTFFFFFFFIDNVLNISSPMPVCCPQARRLMPRRHRALCPRACAPPPLLPFPLFVFLGIAIVATHPLPSSSSSHHLIVTDELFSSALFVLHDAREERIFDISGKVRKSSEKFGNVCRCDRGTDFSRHFSAIHSRVENTHKGKRFFFCDNVVPGQVLKSRSNWCSPPECLGGTIEMRGFYYIQIYSFKLISWYK